MFRVARAEDKLHGAVAAQLTNRVETFPFEMHTQFRVELARRVRFALAHVRRGVEPRAGLEEHDGLLALTALRAPAALRELEQEGPLVVQVVDVGEPRAHH